MVGGEKPLRVEYRTNKLKPHETPRKTLGIELEPYWWEVSAITLPHLLPKEEPTYSTRI